MISASIHASFATKAGFTVALWAVGGALLSIIAPRESVAYASSLGAIASIAIRNEQSVRSAIGTFLIGVVVGWYGSQLIVIEFVALPEPAIACFMSLLAREIFAKAQKVVSNPSSIISLIKGSK